MANPKKFLASAAVAAGLIGGGVAGVILGVPAVSGAQTTTVPDSPSTSAPAPDPGQTSPDRPHHDGNCPNMGGNRSGEAPASGTSANISFRRGGGGGIRV
jgi:hypothetical protein